MRVAILGFGREGKSSADYWAKKDYQITICDKNESVDTEQYASKLGEDYLANLDAFDLIVRTPIIRTEDIVAANGEHILDKVTSNTNEFLEVCPTRNIIGVTGTKGKGTTSSLITAILKQTGHNVYLAGNIGIPPLELLRNNIQPDDWIVLEMSSYQLSDLRHSPHIAVCLMIEQEHQDWHGSMDDYVQSKQNICMWQSNTDVVVYYSLNPYSKSIAAASKGKQIPYFSEQGAFVDKDAVMIDKHLICKVEDIKLLGRHNWQNVCAAITATWQITQDIDGMRRAISAFSGLPYRLEFRGSHDGIKYYNDSFSSQPESAIAAIEAIEDPKVLIIGGYDRHLDLTRLIKAIKNNEDTVRKVLVIGAAGKRIAESLDKVRFENYEVCDCKTMPEVVASARRLAKEGDSVVLSPGFPSFDMFKNFEERGEMFNEAIGVL